MSSFQFYKSFLFVIELVLAECLFLFRFKRRSKFPLRFILSLIVVFGIAFIIPPDVSKSPIYYSIVFMLIFIITFGAMFASFKVNLSTNIFCCVAGYTLQHLTYEIYSTILLLLNINNNSNFYGNDTFTSIFPNLFVLAIYVVVYVVIYSLAYLLLARNIKGDNPIRIESKFISFLIGILLFIDIFLNAILIGRSTTVDKAYLYLTSIYNIICCVISLYLQFEVSLRNKYQYDYNAVQQLWLKSQEQYKVSKENINMINIKCHDLKHQISSIANQKGIDPKEIEEIAESIDIYDSTAKTNNEALDIVITEKSLYCVKNNITFTYIIDGKQFSFMRDGDIYALFGNIIDNAIEGVLKVDENKREINLHVKKVNNMLMIRQTNYFDGNVEFADGLPITTKNDSKYHGIGTKSIKYIVEKYGGNLNMSFNKNVFEVNIVFFIND